MSGALIGVTVIAAAALLALGGIGVAAVVSMSRNPEDTSHVYGATAMVMSAVFVLALIAFAAAYLVR